MSEAVIEGAAPEGADLLPASSVIVPSGVKIDYFFKPKRKYEADGVEIPSVTTILKVLDKPALSWWGMSVGTKAVQELIQMDVLTIGYDGHQHGLMLADDPSRLLGKYINDSGEEKDELVDLVNKWKLTVNHVLNAASDRGVGVHDALEAWGAVGAIPDHTKFSATERGYVMALEAFLRDADGLEAEGMEMTVASVKHGYAGRYDLLARTTKDITVVTKVYPKRASKVTVVPAGQRLLIDLKTSKYIYPSHFIQLEAYEGGMIECGYGPTDARAVLHVQADGRYEFRRARASLDNFLAIKAASDAMKEVNEGMKL